MAIMRERERERNTTFIVELNGDWSKAVLSLTHCITSHLSTIDH